MQSSGAPFAITKFWCLSRGEVAVRKDGVSALCIASNQVLLLDSLTARLWPSLFTYYICTSINSHTLALCSWYRIMNEHVMNRMSGCVKAWTQALPLPWICIMCTMHDSSVCVLLYSWWMCVQYTIYTNMHGVQGVDILCCAPCTFAHGYHNVLPGLTMESNCQAGSILASANPLLPIPIWSRKQDLEGLLRRKIYHPSLL